MQGSLRGGADGVRLDKFDPERLTALVPRLKSVQPRLIVNAARGIHLDNAAAFAASGADVRVTSCLYKAKAADFGAAMPPA